MIVNARQIGGASPVPPSLPEGYVELKYIESTGTQYVDTLFHPTTLSRIISDIEPISTDGTKGLFGARDASSSTADKMFILWIRTEVELRTDYFGSSKRFSVQNALSRFKVDKNRNETTVDGETTINSPVSDYRICEKSLFIFNVNPGKYMSIARLYSMKIFDDDVLARNFVPCTNPQGEIGLYDLVGKQFYGNAGTGVFIAGPEVEA